MLMVSVKAARVGGGLGRTALARMLRVPVPGIPGRVLVAPDKFKGTFRATEVAAALGRGLEAGGCPPPDLCPVADGGEGTLEVLLTALGGETAAAAPSIRSDGR